MSLLHLRGLKCLSRANFGSFSKIQLWQPIRGVSSIRAGVSGDPRNALGGSSQPVSGSPAMYFRRSTSALPSIPAAFFGSLRKALRKSPRYVPVGVRNKFLKVLAASFQNIMRVSGVIVKASEVPAAKFQRVFRESHIRPAATGEYVGYPLKFPRQGVPLGMLRKPEKFQKVVLESFSESGRGWKEQQVSEKWSRRPPRLLQRSYEGKRGVARSRSRSSGLSIRSPFQVSATFSGLDATVFRAVTAVDLKEEGLVFAGGSRIPDGSAQ